MKTPIPSLAFKAICLAAAALIAVRANAAAPDDAPVRSVKRDDGILVLDARTQDRPQGAGGNTGGAGGTKTPAFQAPAMWEYSAPLIAPEKRDRNTSVAQKDPTVVFHGGKWHVFMTVKLPGRTAIEYCSFARWEDAGKSKRTMVKVSESKYFGAPQAFFFVPHKKWYLIYQVGVPGAKFMWVAYSMAADVADPGSWTPARPILDGGPKDPRKVGGLDYWIICDDQRAYLFLTSLDGKMWRLVNGEDRPTWTSDGQSLVYRTELSGIDRYDLTIIAADGVGGPANYTNTSNRRERGPAWNPQWDPLGPGAF